MAIYKVIYLPDPRLRQKCEPITTFDASLHILIEDMFETMYATRGVGLAAPQIGINLQLSVIDVVGEKQQQLVLINPVIIESRGQTVYHEGCLSIPNVWEKVTRASWVRIRALDRCGVSYEMEGSGHLGECFQHEIDHLNGKLLIDYLSPLKRKLARYKLEKYKRTMDR